MGQHGLQLLLVFAKVLRRGGPLALPKSDAKELGSRLVGPARIHLNIATDFAWSASVSQHAAGPGIPLRLAQETSKVVGVRM